LKNLKVLLAFPIQDKHTGYFILKALKTLGCFVEVIDAKIYPFTLFDVAKRSCPDFILCSRTAQLLNNIMRIKIAMPNTKIFCWNTDLRESLDEYRSHFGQDLIELFKICDIVYLATKGEVDIFKTANISAKWLPQGIDPEENDRPQTECNYQYDISFLGALDNFHERTCQRISLISELKKHFNVNTNPAFLRDANTVYYTSKINLGSNAYPYIECGPSVRDFKIMASCGFLLTNYMKGFENMFEIEKECDVYYNIQDCIEKCKYYLENEDKRWEIAKYSYTKAHAQYKYSDRIKTILKDYHGMQ
jgi:hypothetical protein